MTKEMPKDLGDLLVTFLANEKGHRATLEVAFALGTARSIVALPAVLTRMLAMPDKALGNLPPDAMETLLGAWLAEELAKPWDYRAAIPAELREKLDEVMEAKAKSGSETSDKD